MGAAFDNWHNIVPEVGGEGVVEGLFGEEDGLFLVVAVIDLDMEDTTFQILHNFTLLYFFLFKTIIAIVHSAFTFQFFV